MKQEEFSLLLEKENRSIYSFCLYLSGSRQIAEDLYQECCLYALERLESIDPERNPKSYLLSLATHIWQNEWRKKARRQRILPQVSLEEARENGQIGVSLHGQAEELTPDEILINRESKIRLFRAVDDLVDLYRIPILLYYTGGLTYQEIAETLAIPLGTVKRRLHQAKKMLRVSLGGTGESHEKVK